MMTANPESNAPRAGWLRSNLLTVSIAGVLLTGGAVGLAFNHPAASGGEAVAVIPGDPATDVTAPVAVPDEAIPAPTLVKSAMVRRPTFEDLTPPQNPFLRTSADPLPQAEVTSVPASAPGTVAARQPQPAVAPAPRPAAPEPAVAAEDLVITGMVQGDPPLVVVRYEGQSLFLKIGDQVANTWRLVEIRERSAIFQLGAQRVEVPIQGGSSE